MNLYMPKQHGAWAMLVLPFLLGIIAGGFSWWQVPLLIGWISLYLATYPLIMAVKKKKIEFHLSWFYKYISVATLALLPVVIFNTTLFWVGLMMVPFFIINIVFGKHNKDRSLWNDLSAIAAFSFSGMATYYLGSGSIDSTAWLIVAIPILFFTGSTLFVKTMIREKKNPAYRWISWGYHIFVVGLGAALGSWLLTVAFLPSLVRAVYLYGRKMKPMEMGILEIGNSAVFLAIISISFF
ncbi:YwiC-like family protein [Thalassobacillus pellis]|uniref:YwiC-like family protein n=1 Tax=Thalassobacillus pellis TaxID=748008 RepID=UPI001961EEF0|nr:YwiC-like family protein [Thalassobacillus pellis]MBM7554049.1 uncharacterized membrane protein YciS (DUF1049 family) [Thalassobacillus pellis]